MPLFAVCSTAGPGSLENYIHCHLRVGSRSALQLGAKGEDYHQATLTMSVKFLGLGCLFCRIVKGLEIGGGE